MPNEETLTHWDVTIDGAPVPGLMNAIRSIEVDQNLFLPGMCIIRINDLVDRGQASQPGGSGAPWIENAKLGLGHSIAVNSSRGPGKNAPVAEIFAGDVVGLDGDYEPDGHTMISIRAYDRSHRMQRGSKVRSWNRISDSGIATKVAQEYGLTVEADTTPAIHEIMIQDNVADFAFLQERAKASGRVMMVSGTKLLFKKLDSLSTSVVELDLGQNLLEFHPRLSASGQVTEVETKGWDPKTKREIVARASIGKSTAQRSDIGRNGIALYRGASGTAAPTLTITDTSPSDQAAADATAKSRLEKIWAGDFRAEGVALGDPSIRAGGRVKVTNQGQFNGEYVVTTASHIYDGGHYLVRFTIAGLEAGTLADLMSPEPVHSRPSSSRVVPGPAIAVVTDARDPQGLGRIKVKFPWLDANVQSGWARLATPMAGADRGFMFLPEVNDEVLVAFEQGDFNRPYIIGGLWNGQDRPPETSAAVLSGSGEVDRRLIKTRAGHVVVLNDAMGKESIEVIDKTGKNKIVIESATNKITITSAGDIELKATQKITLDAVSIEVKGSQSVSVEAPQVAVDATATATVKGAQVEVNGSATTTIKGGIVQIN